MSGWPTKRLCDLTELLSGFAFDSERFGGTGDVPLVRIRDVVRGKSSTFYSGEFDEKYLVHAGDILIGMDGEFNSARWRSDDALLNQRVCRIESTTEKLDGAYLYHFLPKALKAIERVTPFVTVKHLSVRQIRHISIPLPPLSEQRRIAEILDKADALRAKRRATLAQLETLTQSIFFDMFGDPSTNPNGWPKNVLGELITSGPQNGLYRPANDYGSGTPILRIDAFYDGMITKLDNLKRVRISANDASLYALHAGEIVINRVNSREYLGKSALIPALRELTVFESNMMRFDVDRGVVAPGYLIQFLQTQYVRSHILRSAKDAVNQSSINQQDVKALSVIVPPLALQQAFVRRSDAIDRWVVHQKASLAMLDACFASLQHRAFRGEL